MEAFNMMRLVFVNSQFVSGGAERHAISLMNRLVERGHECHSVYVKAGGQMMERIRLNERGTVLCLKAARYLDRRAIADFAAMLARVRPDAVVAANAYALMYSTLAVRLARVPARVVATYHTTQLHDMKERIQMLVYRPMFWAADCTIFVSTAQSRYCMRRGVFSRRNEVIHNGIDTEWFREAGEGAREAMRGTLGYGAGDYVVGLSAVLRPEKNHVQLVDAIAQLRAQGLPARALMIGGGDTQAAVEQRARELNVTDWITITGLKPDVRPYIGACDAMALCSTAVETFSLAALEAMAMGKPVMHARLGGAAEMVFPGWNGYLFTPRDTQALVDGLTLLADPAVSARMGRNARRGVESLFSEGAMVDRYERLLGDLCNATSAPEGLWPAGHHLNIPGV
jgi:glycosyltransferase involved in cell wall biosynthesis